jgi:hypothetical protein
MLSDTLLDSFRCALTQATNDAEFMVPCELWLENASNVVICT